MRKKQSTPNVADIEFAGDPTPVVGDSRNESEDTRSRRSTGATVKVSTGPGYPAVSAATTTTSTSRDAIDWSRQPHVPAEKIDWSKQGEPLRVRPTLGTLVTALMVAASVLGGGAYFYWGVRTHMDNAQVHLPRDGVPWGVKSKYETKAESRAAHARLRRDIVQAMRVEYSRLRDDIVKAISDTPAKSRRVRSRRRRR